VKFRHVLLALFAVLAIAFMQPLVTFIGGLTLLLGAGALIFRDLTPAGQDAVERRVLGWLRRARNPDPPLTIDEKSRDSRKLTMDRPETGMLTQTFRRGRAKTTARNAPSEGTTESANHEHPPNPKA